MYQDDLNILTDEIAADNLACDVIELVKPVKEYNHKEFIINELRRARIETMENPTPGRIVSLLVWMDTLINQIDKETAEESLKISA